MQAGLITAKEMKFAIFLFILFSVISGLSSLYSAWGRVDQQIILPCGFGILGVLAAISTQWGANPMAILALVIWLCSCFLASLCWAHYCSKSELLRPIVGHLLLRWSFSYVCVIINNLR